MRPISAPPFCPGTTSLGLYTNPAAPGVMLDRLFAQAAAASLVGLAGVTISEHHGGFPGYVPNPVQLAGWMLDRVPTVWCAACPLLLTLRPPVTVAEELCWMSALHPGRVGVGFAPGYLAADFELFDQDVGQRADQFSKRLLTTAAIITGRGWRSLDADPAVASTSDSPVPFVAAAGSPRAARRAAEAGGGILTDSLAPMDRVRTLFDVYDEAGGRGPRVVNRRIWIGAPPVELVQSQLAHFAGASAGPPSLNDRTGPIVHGTPAEVADQLVATVASTGATHLGLKFHLTGVTQHQALDQIEALEDVLPAVEVALGNSAQE